MNKAIVLMIMPQITDKYSLLNAKKPCASAGSVQSTGLQISIAYQMHNCALLNVMHKILCLK